MPRRVLVDAVLAFTLAACLAPACANAAKVPACGSRDPDGNAILGSLALNDNSSTVKSYGTSSDVHQLALLYDVTGCTLPKGTSVGPAGVAVLPAKTGDDLPGKPAVTVTAERPDPTALAVTVLLKLGDIDPGTHGGVVRIHVPQYLHDSFTPISVSRTGGWRWPLVLGLLGSLAGILWAVALHAADTIALKFTLQQAVLLGALAIGAGAVAGYGYWHNQDVWTLGDNGWATLVSGFTASTAGALAGVTTALISPKREAKGAQHGGAQEGSASTPHAPPERRDENAST